MNVLLTCAGRRAYLAQYFKAEILGTGSVTGVDLTIDAPALQFCDYKYKTSKVGSVSYIDELLSICLKRNINLLVPLSDLEIILLTNYEETFKEIGTVIVSSPAKAAEICNDKWKTYSFCKDNLICTAQTFLSKLDAIAALDLDQIKFPLVVKPRYGSASIGISFAQSIADLDRLIGHASLVSNNGGLDEKYKETIIQEVLTGNEHGVDVFNDLDSNYIATVAKRKLSMRAGETDKAMTVCNAPFISVGRRISQLLRHTGNLDCDFFVDGDSVKVLEMNLRFGGGYPFSHEAGANLVRALLLSARGQADQINVGYKNNLVFAKYDLVTKCN